MSATPAASDTRISVERAEAEKVQRLANEIFSNGGWAKGGLIADICNRWLNAIPVAAAGDTRISVEREAIEDVLEDLAAIAFNSPVAGRTIRKIRGWLPESDNAR